VILPDYLAVARTGRDAGENAGLQYLSDHPVAEKAFRARTDRAGRGLIKINYSSRQCEKRVEQFLVKPKKVWQH
jgi:hypothetical protein